MIVDDITVEVRNKALQRKGIIAPEMLDLKAVKRHLNVGEWHLTLPREHAMVPLLWTPGSGIIITLRNKVWMSGPTSSPAFEAKPEDPAGSITFSGVDDKIILADALCWPLPSQPNVTLQTDSHDVRTGPAETVMKQYVNANIGPGAPLDRRGTFAQQLDVAADLERGATVTKSARFPNLLELLSEIGLYANMGFDVVQQGLELIFDVYEIRDLHDLIRFDIDNGTLEDETVQISAPTVTRPIVAGQGEQEDRTFIQRTSVDSLQAEDDWGRKIEQFIDQRNTNDLDELAQAGDEALAEDGFTAAAVKAVPADDLTREYITDWDIGDMVTVEMLNQPTITTITEAALVANSSGIAVAAAIGDVSGFDADSAMGGRVDDTAKRVSALERTAENGGGGNTVIGRQVGETFFWLAPVATPLPLGCLALEGGTASRTTYAVLYALWGTSFGAGDGSTTFGLPDFRKRAPVGYDSSDADFTPIGKTGGEKTHTLTAAESGLKAHTHPNVTVAGNSAYTLGLAGAGTATNVAPPGGSATTYAQAFTVGANTASDASSAHNNMPPYLVGRWLVKAAYTGAEVDPGIGHVHSAADITSGQLNPARLPAFVQSTGTLSFVSTYRAATINNRDPLRLYKDAFGRAHLEGIFESAVVGFGAITQYGQYQVGALPAGFIPAKTLSVPIMFSISSVWTVPAHLIIHGSTVESDFVGSAGQIYWQPTLGRSSSDVAAGAAFWHGVDASWMPVA